MAQIELDGASTGEARSPAGLAERSEGAVVSLTLFVAGASDRSQKAVVLVKRLCEEVLIDGYDLEVIDVYQTLDAARETQVMVVPTLIRRLPAPVRRFSGDFSDRTEVLSRLGL